MDPNISSEITIPVHKNLANKFWKFIGRYLLYLMGLQLLVYCYMSFLDYGLNYWYWDPMFISGTLALMLAIFIARSTPEKMVQTIDRLTSRSVLEISAETLDSLKKKIINRGNRVANITAYIVGLIMFIALLWAFGVDFISDAGIITLLEIIYGIAAGYYIGQMVAFGSLGQLIRKEKIAVVSMPGHIDQAAGLKPIGDYYFIIARALIIPCAFVAVWWLIIPMHPSGGYTQWNEPFVLLFTAGIIFEFLSFFVPMWTFHKIMQKQKIKYLNDADGISEEIIKLEKHILFMDDIKNLSDIQKQLDFLREKYWKIEQMPTWPVDIVIRKKFATTNLLVFVPFVLDVIKSSSPWKNIVDILVEFLTSS